MTSLPPNGYEFPLRYDRAQHDLGRNPAVPVIVIGPAALGQGESDDRHVAQIAALPNPLPTFANTPPDVFGIPLDKRFYKARLGICGQNGGTSGYHIEDLTMFDGGSLFPAAGPTPPAGAQFAYSAGALYLFNVIVALEWRPSLRTVRYLVSALQQASDLLYDATDGRMAVGQVVIGGRELFDGADVQICASNRYYPRSWVDGLLDELKYTPIRLGRGWWRKDLGRLIAWGDAASTPVIVHEWCHYALGLRDEYLTRVPLETTLIAGTQRLAAAPSAVRTVNSIVTIRPDVGSGSIMETVEGSSEVVPASIRPNNQATQNAARLVARYPDAGLPQIPLDGPSELPLDLPVIQQHLPGDIVEEALWDAWLDPAVSGGLQHAWIYLLRGQPGAWQQLIPQGMLHGQVQQDGFVLLGARPGDRVLAVGSDGGGLRLYTSALGDAPASGLSGGHLPVVATALSQIPRPEGRPERPVVTVIPGVPQVVNRTPNSALATYHLPANTERITGVRVRVAGVPAALLQGGRLEAWLFPLGGFGGAWPQPVALSPVAGSADVVISGWVGGLPSLDGQVLLTLDGAPVAVADYSEGGGPETSVRAPEPPISAGSSEGNAMFYFGQPDPGDPRTYSDIRIVTTRNYGGFEQARTQTEARSYLFSFACSLNVPFNPLTPTLALTYDADVQTTPAGVVDYTDRFNLYRYDEDPAVRAWQAEPVYASRDNRFYRPLGATLMQHNASTSASDRATIYHYRIFLDP